MTKRIAARCDGCKKELVDYGWIDIHITETGPTNNFDGGDYQFCDRKCLGAWATKPGIIKRLIGVSD